MQLSTSKVRSKLNLWTSAVNVCVSLLPCSRISQFSFYLFNRSTIDYFKNRDMHLVLWTVNDPKEKKYFGECLNLPYMTDTLFENTELWCQIMLGMFQVVFPYRFYLPEWPKVLWLVIITIWHFYVIPNVTVLKHGREKSIFIMYQGSMTPADTKTIFYIKPICCWDLFTPFLSGAHLMF